MNRGGNIVVIEVGGVGCHSHHGHPVEVGAQLELIEYADDREPLILGLRTSIGESGEFRPDLYGRYLHLDDVGHR